MNKYEQLKNDIIIAMKSKESVKLTFLRYLNSLIQRKSLDTRKEITDEMMIDVFKSEQKKILESIDLYTKHQETDKLNQSKLEKEIIECYLPYYLDESETESFLKDFLKENNFSSIKDMGKIMGEIKKMYVSIDLSIASKILKKLLK